MIRAAFVTLLALCASGCILERSGTAPSDGGDEVDGGDLPNPDAGDPPTEDGGADAGPMCAGDPICDGDTLRSCVAGALVDEDCQRSDGYCDGGLCVPWLCMPGSVACSDDEARLLRCDDRGSARMEMPCPRGCAPGVGCRAEVECELDEVGTITDEGTLTVNTCGQGNDTSALGCGGSALSGPDVIVRLVVTRPGRFQLEVRRPANTTDPLLYIRTECASRMSEIACNDDAHSTTRSSRITEDLRPGEYFLMVDSFRGVGELAEAHCGGKNVIVTRLP